MLVQGPILAAAPTRQGGWVLHRSGPSLAIRARPQPLNPQTPRRHATAGRLRQLVGRWRHTLTAAQRDDWEVWASATPWANWTGARLILRGVNAYIAQSLPRLSAGLAPLDDAPTEVGPTPVTPPIAQPTTDGDLLVTIDPADPWANTDGSAMVLSLSGPYRAAASPRRPTMRHLAAILGSATSPPPAEHSIPIPTGPPPTAAASYTLATHVTDPVRGPAIPAKGPLPRPLTPEPPTPASCPCWPPPCGDLAATYVAHVTARSCDDCTEEVSLDVVIEADPLIECIWFGEDSQTGWSVEVALGEHPLGTPAWVAVVDDISCGFNDPFKQTGGSPIGTYDLSTQEPCGIDTGTITGFAVSA